LILSVATKLNIAQDAVLPSSTGIIGWRLPTAALIEGAVPAAIDSLKTNNLDAVDAARAIMTTDRFPKLRSAKLSNGASIVGIAKGAGMIEPNMATMLSFIMTDASVSRSDLQRMLSSAVCESFNSISVDGAESTSDTAVVLSSNKFDNTDLSEFEREFVAICKGLAGDIVRNGEGTKHVIRVNVENFPGSNEEARGLGRAVVNSPLFKCAVAGNDPNIGRLAAAIGSFMGKNNFFGASDGMEMKIGEEIVFKGGKFFITGEDVEKMLSSHMQDAEFGEEDDYPQHQKYVEINVNWCEGGGAGRAVVLGSDLTKEYVNINADYRS
jgi:glutamate N-acetyltransferase/amino-acid N-acetyltransferase